MNKLLLFAVALFTSVLSFGQCDIIYVTTAGLPSATGTMADPLDLETAVLTANPGDLIRIGTGNYLIDNPLTIPYDNVILEGGFDDFNGWVKSSMAGATTITRSNLNPEGSINDYRLVCIYADGITGFEFHDLTVTTEAGADPGTSTYGMHIQNCSNYYIVRCVVTSGNATNGMAGSSGTGGLNGSNGNNGFAGSIDGNGSGGAGGISGAGGGLNGGTFVGGGTNPAGSGQVGGAGPAGNASTDPRDGGSGGGGGAGGETDHNGGPGGAGGGVNGGAGQTGGGLAGAWGDPGGDGTNGATGAAGADGTQGAAGSSWQLNTFFVAGGQGATGTDGSGGKGGVGGGGGGGQSCFFCDDGSGDGGGGGGGGGQGGTGGTGGFGGGSAFGVYLFSNGPNGNIINSNLSSGTFGQGGLGGPGGQGGSGGIGGLGSTYGTSEVGEGGDGGAGGVGGDGGAGGDGIDGIAGALVQVGGDALTTNDNAFDLAGQPEITVTYSTCVNESVSVRDESLPIGSGSTAWDFGANATNQTSSQNPAVTAFTTIGMNDVIQGANTYTGFINITCSVDASATLSGFTITATTAGASYQWINCNTGNSIIPGETSQSYTPSVSGDYAVIVDDGNCVDTSACILVSGAGVDELTYGTISVYPNPANDVVNIAFDEKVMDATLMLYDIKGQLIEQVELDNLQQYELELNVPPGVYQIRITSDNVNYRSQIIKQ